MQKCKQCGAMIDDDAGYCEYCGVSFGGKTKNAENNFATSDNDVAGSKVKTSTIFGIFAIVFSASFIGLILAILGLKESKKDDGQIGKVLSIISIVIFILSVLAVVITIVSVIIGGIAFFDSVNEIDGEFSYEFYDNINLFVKTFIR